MRIIDKQTFLALPPGTVYAEYLPKSTDIDHISIKEKTSYDGERAWRKSWFLIKRKFKA